MALDVSSTGRQKKEGWVREGEKERERVERTGEREREGERSQEVNGAFRTWRMMRRTRWNFALLPGPV